MLGHGGYGVVMLEHRVDDIDATGAEGSPPRERAVKMVLTQGRQPIHYVRELEALAKFSQAKVRRLLPNGGILNMGLMTITFSTRDSLSRSWAGSRAQNISTLPWNTARTGTSRIIYRRVVADFLKAKSRPSPLKSWRAS
jgi:hypothetical protein